MRIKLAMRLVRCGDRWLILAPHTDASRDGLPYGRGCGMTVGKPVGNRVLRIVGYAFCGMVLVVALFTAMQPGDHTRFHATARHAPTKNFK